MKRPLASLAFLLSAALLGLSARGLAETTPPQPVDLLSDINFLVLSGAGIQNLSGPSLIFNGNIGTSPGPGSSITGITAAQVIGNMYTADATGPSGSTIDATLL